MLHGPLLKFGLLSFIALNAGSSCRPQGMDNSSAGNVHVHIVYANGRGAGLQLRVRLMSGPGSTPISESFTNDQGVTEFTGVRVGEYHVIVTGEGIEQTDSGAFEIDRRKMSQSVFITVHPINKSASQQVVQGSSSVAAVDLNVPDSAREEFDKANDAMANQNWTKALQRLNRAISIYPKYAPAYNNLGVVYSHLNDAAHERESLEKAISLNDHFVPAFINLAKLCIKERNSAQAETLLESASRLEPANAGTLTLLAEAQLLNKDFDAAIASAQRVHTIPHENFAVVHYIAARALEHENRSPEAVAELQIFLAEEPKGARAEHVREEIAQLQNGRP